MEQYSVEQNPTAPNGERGTEHQIEKFGETAKTTPRSSKRDAIEHRRTQVARRRIRGESQRAIAQALQVSLGTINRDLKALDARWRKNADLDIGTHRARQLAEIDEIKRWAYLQVADPRAMRALLMAIKLEAQIIGTLQPPSFVLNLAFFTQLVKAAEASGLTPGEAFEAMFQTLAKQKQGRVFDLEKAG